MIKWYANRSLEPVTVKGHSIPQGGKVILTEHQAQLNKKSFIVAEPPIDPKEIIIPDDLKQWNEEKEPVEVAKNETVIQDDEDGELST